MDSSMEKGRNTLEIRPEEWERYKTLIRELYIDQDMSLRQVQDFMIQAHGFYAKYAIH
jgi:hypothetical protein